MYDYDVIANYHTHTSRCMHACGEDREYVEEAIKSGLKILGFADHTPYPTREGFISGMRMSLSAADGYFQSVMDLKEEYKNDIAIYAGVEAEYFPEYFHKLIEFLKDYPVDYMILGNHFIPEEERGVYIGAPFTDKKPLEGYADNVIEGIKSGKFAYVAHPDLPNYVGEDKEEARAAIFHRICKAAKEYNVPLEINVLGHMRQIQYPCDRFFKIASEYGNDVIIGMDVHNPKHFHKKEAINYCIDIAKRHNLNLLKKLDL